jgi:hypothetical protein
MVFHFFEHFFKAILSDLYAHLSTMAMSWPGFCDQVFGLIFSLLDC